MSARLPAVWCQTSVGAGASPHGQFDCPRIAESKCFVEIEKYLTPLRPVEAVLLDHASDVAVNGLTVEGNPQAVATLRLIATSDALLSATRVLKSAAVFLQVEDAGSKGIVVDGGDMSNASKQLVLEAGATSEAVKLRI